MKQELLQVTEFHKRIDAPIAQQPELLPGSCSQATRMATQLRTLISEFQLHANQDNLLISRCLMSLEEMAEWLEAHSAGDLAAATDAWADRCYVLFGDAVASGLPAAEAFASVHASNMTKQGQDRATGKGLKGKDYVQPDLSGNFAVENTGDRETQD